MLPFVNMNITGTPEIIETINSEDRDYDNKLDSICEQRLLNTQKEMSILVIIEKYCRTRISDSFINIFYNSRPYRINLIILSKYSELSPEYRYNIDFAFISSQNTTKIVLNDISVIPKNLKYIKNVLTMTKSILIIDHKKEVYYYKEP